MNRWPTKSLEQIADLFGGSTPSRSNPAFWGGNIHWVTPTDLPMPDEGISIASKSKDRITQAGLDNSAATVVPKGTVLFSSRATIGKVAIADLPLTTNQGFVNFVPHTEISSRFLAYSLWNRREDISRFSGSTTFKEVSRSTLRKYQISVPPLAEQERIVRLLDEADGLRKLRAQSERRVAEFAPALFDEMFGDITTNPMRWPKVTLGEVVKFVGGGTPSRANQEFFDGTIPWATSKDVKSDYMGDTQEHVTEDAIAKSATNIVPAGSVLIVVKSKILMHSLPLAITTVPMCFGQDLKGLICGSKALPEFIFSSLRTQKSAILVQARGANTEGLTLEILRAVKILLPPLPLQEEFAQRVTRIREMSAKQAASRRRLEELFQSLLHRAFKGEL